jgi:LETM1 and EF-hand domain-containing protein 1
MIPLIVILIVPFAELGLPVLLRLFPNLLPSQFEKSDLRQEAYKRSLHTRMELHGILHEVLEEHTKNWAAKGAAGAQASAGELLAQMDAVRRGESMTPSAIVKVAALFKDDLTLDTLPRGQLATLAKYMGLSPFIPDPVLRLQLKKRLADLKEDDALLYREGTQGLTKAELKAACDSRGMRSVGLSESLYREQLDEWLLLSIKHDVSSTILLLSRSFAVAPGGGEAPGVSVGSGVTAAAGSTIASSDSRG